VEEVGHVREFPGSVREFPGSIREFSGSLREFPGSVHEFPGGIRENTRVLVLSMYEGSYLLPAVSAGSGGNRSNIVGFSVRFERPTNGNRRKHTFIVLYTNYFMPTTPTYYSHTLFLPNTLYILYSLPTDPYLVVSTL